MRFDPLLTDEAVLAELGRRLSQARIAHRLTQADLAEAAGVSKRTIERMEGGVSVQLHSLIRALRALDRLDGLDRLLPETPANPIDLLRRRRPMRVRSRARREPRPDAGQPAPPGARWTWGDDDA
ncbi:MAG TPA: helix-turn-helix transcriptional regulator [Caulobacteraceae bacterium]|jgi:transcriptional regulator with XRE-family HTH domain|nr:helix-turn-helix transcriptional regulator [Caulobacteraceae bacterium]